MRHLQVLTGVVLLAWGGLACADDDEAGITFVPSIAYQHKQLRFEQTYSGGIQNGRSSEFELYLPTLNASLTTAIQKFYVTLKYEDSLASGSTSADETLPANNIYFLNIPGEQTKVKRRDMSITFGANVWRGLNVFLGYMKGETVLSPEPGTNPPFAPLPPNFVENLAKEQTEIGLPEYQQQYTENGPYGGVSYGWRIGDAGTLSASAAYASMDGRYKDNYAYADWPCGIACRHYSPTMYFDFEGDSVGTSVGMTWSAPLGDTSAYFVDIRRQKYSMDGNDVTPTAAFAGIDVKTDETMLGLTAGVQFYY